LKEWLAKHGRDAGFALAAILAAGSFALPAGLPARWAATAVLILCLGSLLREWYPRAAAALDDRRPGWRELAARWFPYLAVAVGTLIALGPVALGQMPVSQDHANHYQFTEILVHDMIPTGRMFGWTDRVGAGYPFGDIHYTLCYLVTGLPHLITFGLIDLDTSYAVGICVAWLVSSLAVVALARRLGAGPFGAAFVGLANAFDVGSDREGGWTYSMFHGVWPQQLATGVWVFALLALWRLGEKPDTRRMALAALLGGVSILVHPMGSLVMLLGGIALFAVRLLHRDPGSAPGDPRGAIRLIPALALAGVIGLLWAARMMAWGDSMWSGEVYWEQLPQLAARALGDSLFEHQLAAVGVLSLVGAVAALRSRRKFALLVVLLAAMLLAVGAMDLVLSADLGLAGGPFKTLQYRRFSIPAKPLWYALAALGIAAAARGIAAGFGDKLRAAAGNPGLRVLLAVVLAPLAWGAVCALPTLVDSPAARPLTLRRAGEVENNAAIRALLERERERLGWRIKRAVYWEKPGHGGRYPMLAMTDAGFGLLPTVFPPAQNFQDIARTTDVDAMRGLGASIIVSRWPVEHEELEEIGRHGAHRVYRFKSPPRAPARMRGPGRVRVAEWGPETKVLEVAGASPGSRVLLGLSPFGKWSAAQDDRDLELVPARVGGMLLTEIRGAEDGEIRLSYRDTAVEDAAFLAGLIALLACIAGLVLRPRPLPVRWPAERLATTYRALAWALGVLLLAVIAAAAAGGGAAVETEWLAGEADGASVAAVLHRQGVAGFETEPEHFCVKPHTRDPKWGCNEESLAPRLAPAAVRHGKIPSCLSVGVPPSGRSLVTFDLTDESRVVTGRLHADSGTVGAAIRFDVASSARTPLEPASRKGGRFRATIPEGATSVSLELTNDRPKPTRVCIEAVALAGGVKKK
jgi:hypothetical protein